MRPVSMVHASHQLTTRVAAARLHRAATPPLAEVSRQSGTAAQPPSGRGNAPGGMSSADTELAALDTIVRTLNSLDREQLTRVLSYVRSRYAPGSNGEDALGNGRTKAVQPQIRARHTGGENLVTTV